MSITDQNSDSPSAQQLAEDEEVVVKVDDLDLDALAKEVIKLLKQELRIENERRGWHRVW